MKSYTGIVLAVLVLCEALSAAEAQAPPRANPPPAPTSFAETLEKRLVQLDVGVEGDAEAIRGITAEDFVLHVGEREVRGLIVDPLCGAMPSDSASEPHAVRPDGPASVVPKVARPQATFIFYFDQPHLTQSGRERSIDTSRDLVHRLIVEGARASIVSSASRLETIVPLTGDRKKLLAGLESLRTNLKQWDTYAVTEVSRARQLYASRTRFHRCSAAKYYAREEYGEARRATQRIGTVVSRLTEVAAPKALVYFGDTLRDNAGMHFLKLGCGWTGPMETIPSAAVEFDDLVKEALARSVHFFTIQAEGFGLYNGAWDRDRHRDAQGSLMGLAARTGGEAFLSGTSDEKIADSIEALSSCRLLLSFPPGDFPRDEALGVTIELNVPKVKLRAQDKIVIPSAASIERARLLAAFVDPASMDDGSLRALLIPRGGDGKTWKAVVQLRLRPTGVPGSSAELGASILRRDKVADQFSASIATKAGSRPIVLEKTLDLAAGGFSVVAVARDAKRGDIGSTRLDAEWPNAARNEASVAPIAALQLGAAAMSRDGIVGSSGLLAQDVDEPLDPASSVTLETVVCRGGRTKAPIVIERWLEDGLPNEFAPMTIAEDGEPCAQIVDVVKAGRLGPGVVDYRVTARIGDDVVAHERRALRVGTAP